MKIDEKVCRAFDILIDAAENSFELRRIEKLFRDLTNPPKLEKIDDRHIAFNGTKFMKNKRRGYYKADILLHKVIYEYCFTDIPKGFEIHHIDNNPANNALENLMCLSKADHTRIHYATSTGRFAKREMICEVCGKSFIKPYHGANRFCSDKCRKAAYNQECKIIKTCRYCGKNFEIENYSTVTHCSVSCAQKDRQRDRWEEKYCPVCGKKFIARKKAHQRYCSVDCSRKFLTSSTHEKRYCLFCGKEFDTLKAKDTKYCSRKCYFSHKLQTNQ